MTSRWAPAPLEPAPTFTLPPPHWEDWELGSSCGLESDRGGRRFRPPSMIQSRSSADSSTPMGRVLTRKTHGSTPLRSIKQPIRRVRIVQLAEAHCLFAALFLNGTWFVYEYGAAGAPSERRSDRDGYFYGVWGRRVFNLERSQSLSLATFSWPCSVDFCGSSVSCSGGRIATGSTEPILSFSCANCSSPLSF